MKKYTTYNKKNAKLVRDAFRSTSTALQNIAPDGGQCGGDDTFLAQGVELAIDSWRGKEVELPQLDAMEYRPKQAPFILQLIDKDTGSIIFQSEHNGLASACWNYGKTLPLKACVVYYGSTLPVRGIVMFSTQ